VLLYYISFSHFNAFVEYFTYYVTLCWYHGLPDINIKKLLIYLFIYLLTYLLTYLLIKCHLFQSALLSSHPVPAHQIRLALYKFSCMYAYKYQYIISFNIFIQRSNNKRFFMQISIIIRQLKRMITQTQITCTIRWKQMVKGMTTRANFCKEFIIHGYKQNRIGATIIY